MGGQIKEAGQSLMIRTPAAHWRTDKFFLHPLLQTLSFKQYRASDSQTSTTRLYARATLLDAREQRNVPFVFDTGPTKAAPPTFFCFLFLAKKQHQLSLFFSYTYFHDDYVKRLHIDRVELGNPGKIQRPFPPLGFCFLSWTYVSPPHLIFISSPLLSLFVNDFL